LTLAIALSLGAGGVVHAASPQVTPTAANEAASMQKMQEIGAEAFTSHCVRYPQFMDAFMKAKTEFLRGNKPAWTAIGAAALGTPETLVEIKAVAKAR
jgi:enamine deaminase RidA (YjgF/YER057c/UK114 family)